MHSSYPALGIPEIILLDNAKDFHFTRIAQILAALNADLALGGASAFEDREAISPPG